MEILIFTIRDSKGEFYHQPVFSRSKGEMTRHFQELANDPKAQVSKYPEDFDLYMTGKFDDQTGQITSLETPQHMHKAVHLIVKN